MKKSTTVTIITAAAVMACTGCTKVENTTAVNQRNANEISAISMMGRNQSKGFITGTAFAEVAAGNLHATSPATTDRDMYMSAYLKPQTGAASNYFTGYQFKKDSDVWKNYSGSAFQPVYWPFGGKLDFLAYSVGTPFAEGKVTWNATNCASSVVIDVADTYLTDDIVYAGTYDRESNETTGTDKVAAGLLPLKFHHAQAWINIQMKAVSAGVITVTKVVLSDIYKTGRLTVNNNYESGVNASWDFGEVGGSNYENTTDITALTTDFKNIDLLIPSQKRTSLTVYYKFAGMDNELQYTFNLDKTKSWQSGEKYVYAITLSPVEITVNPSVVAPGTAITDMSWTAGDVSDLTPATI